MVACWADAYAAYDFGPGHPMRPKRLQLTMELAGRLGVLDALEVVEPDPADDATLGLVHHLRYVNTVRDDPVFAAGIAPPDNPPFLRMHESAALITGGSVTAAAAVWAGTHDHAVNIAGGLHHAMPGQASGFCVYNDAAVAVAWLLAQGAQRVAYIDLDAHHGDGVQAAFYDDPRVLTVSLHETGDALFPGTGFPTDVGTGSGEGYAVNVALPPGADDAPWLRAVHAVVPSLVRAYHPQVLVTQCGCDGHRLDPLADLKLTVNSMAAAYRTLHDLAHEVTRGRWVALGGGGYAEEVVPRAWTALLAEAAGRPVDRAAVCDEGGTDGYDPWPGGVGNPDDPVDRAVAATRRAIWPLHGLDPMDARD